MSVFVLVAALHGQQQEPLLLAAAQGDNALAIFKLYGNTLNPVAKVPVGNGVREICVSADGLRAYVSNDKDNTITVVDIDAAKALATIAPPGIKRLDGCATSPDSKKLYVAALELDEVVVISTETNQVLKHVKAGKEPRRVLFSPDARRIYVSSEVSDEITILNAATDTVVDKLKAGGHGPRTMIFLPDQKTMLNTNVDDDTVSFTKVATKDVYLTIGAGGSPQRLALSDDGKSAFVLSVLEEKISIIDMKGEHIRAKKFVPVGHQPWGMAMSKDKKLLFVGNSKDNTIVTYDAGSMAIVGKVTVNRPMGIAFR
ncbi:MAG: beta-propeller fold lactonase family protein [Bryobacteraceae bacterium]